MMKKQSLSFIAGCLFTKMDRTVFRAIEGKDDNVGDCEFIPKCWFGLTPSKDYTNDIVGDTKYYLKNYVEDIFKQLYKDYDVTIIKVAPDKQYIRFDYNVVKKAPVKKMTVEQIEKELGYKVEIVSEVAE